MRMDAVGEAQALVGQGRVVHGEDGVGVCQSLPDAEKWAWDEMVCQDHLQTFATAQSFWVSDGPTSGF
jgi:hypothetical protein